MDFEIADRTGEKSVHQIGEACFHIDRFCERTLIAWGYLDVLDRLKKVEEKLDQQEGPKPPQQKQ